MWTVLAFVLLTSTQADGDDSPPRGSEFVTMWRSVVRDGARMGPGSGWFQPGQARFGWKWLVERADADQDGSISPAEFPGPKDLFDRLDRDRSGDLTAADFDWSEGSPQVRQLRMAQARLGMLGLSKEGLVSREDWLALFDRAALGRDQLSVAELARALEPAQPPRRPTPPAPQADPLPGEWGLIEQALSGMGTLDWLFGKTVPSPEMPSRWTLFWGLLKAEVGSPFEGPRLGRQAPDFTLKTQDGTETIHLADLLGPRPVVLIFGSFT